MVISKGNIYYELLNDNAPEKPLSVRNIISTSENRACYTADVTPARKTVIFCVDGSIITAGRRCDKFILSTKPHDPTNEEYWHGHFVELKGSCIHDAIEQLEETIKHPKFNYDSLVKKFARVVGTRFPSNAADPTVEKARKRFLTKYGCELKTMKTGQRDRI